MAEHDSDLRERPRRDRQEDRHREKWTGFVRKLTAKKSRTVQVGVSGKYANLRDAYASIDKALEHCSAHANCKVHIEWIDTSEIWPKECTDPDARNMKMGDGGFRPAYNVQMATDADSGIILNMDVINEGSDAGQMKPMMASDRTTGR